MSFLSILIRTVMVFALVVLYYFIMGRKRISELEVTNLLVIIMMGVLGAIGIIDYRDSLILLILPIIMLGGGFCLFSKVVSKIKVNEDAPIVIINRGRIDFKEMLSQRYNLEDLLTELRRRGISSIEEVDYAILRAGGNLEILIKNSDEEAYPIPLIVNGKIDNNVLVQIGKDEEWLGKILDKEGYALKDVFYGFFKDNQVYLIRNGASGV